MAKYNLFLGTASGSIGDITMYRRNGEQISRARVRQIKNPQSTGQQIQRAIMKTVSLAYSSLKSVCDHSFENVEYGSKSMNYFYKKNLDYLRAGYLANLNNLDYAGYAFVGKTSDVSVMNKYIISKGSLTRSFGVSGVALVATINYDSSATVEDYLKAWDLFSPNSGLTAILAKPFVGTSSNPEEIYTVSDVTGGIQYANYISIKRIFRNSTTIPEEVASMAITDFFEPTDGVNYINQYFENLDTDFWINVMKNSPANDDYDGWASEYWGLAVIRSLYDSENSKWLRSSEQMTFQEITRSSVEYYPGLYPYYATIDWTGENAVVNSDYLLNGSED